MAKQKEECTEYEISSGNIFADLKLDQPEELLARAKLLNDVSVLIKNSGLSQKEVAERLRISQPKVSMLVNGQLSAFSADTLIHYLSLLGCEVQIRIKKPRSRRGIFHHKGHIAVC
jgi:predicted XRE-type DNA-binding protein